MKTIRTNDKQIRNLTSNLSIRSVDNNNPDEMVIEGYFSLFNDETELFDGAYEEVARTAFDDTLDNDVRALYNHNTDFVLGRTKADTLSLKVDEKGLYGVIKINKDDTDAVNLYHRVQRGDISEASFGFNILDETTEEREDGSVKWTINKVDLHEISICPWGAYSNTNVEARHKQVEQHQEKQLQIRKKKLKEMLHKC